MLASFDRNVVPTQLAAYAQWVVWRDTKIPYQPSKPARKASVTDPSTWSSLHDAIQAARGKSIQGIGYVFIGNGIVGVDIDKCINDPELNDRALALLERIGCMYIEISPSGNGYHGYALGELLDTGKRLSLNGLHIEIYDNKRYFTFTGNTVKSLPLEPLKNLESLFSEVEAPSNTASLSLVPSVSSVSSVPSVLIIEQIISDMPAEIYVTSLSTRNGKIFQLARYARKYIRDLNTQMLKVIFDHWFEKSVDHMDNQNYDYNFIEFISACDSVRIPYGMDILSEITRDLEPLPHDLKRICINHSHELLIQYCMALQRVNGENPFFLSCRTAGELIDCDKNTAHRLLKISCSLKLLSKVRVGNQYEAARFRFNPQYLSN